MTTAGGNFSIQTFVFPKRGGKHWRVFMFSINEICRIHSRRTKFFMDSQIKFCPAQSGIVIFIIWTRNVALINYALTLIL